MLRVDANLLLLVVYAMFHFSKQRTIITHSYILHRIDNKEVGDKKCTCIVYGHWVNGTLHSKVLGVRSIWAIGQHID